MGLVSLGIWCAAWGVVPEVWCLRPEGLGTKSPHFHGHHLSHRFSFITGLGADSLVTPSPPTA